MTKAEARKQRKKKERERRIRHAVNLRRNEPSPEYRLDVYLGDKWYVGVMPFKTMDAVNVYRDDLESKRAQGEGVIGGRIVSIRTGDTVMVIEPSKKKEMKGSLPDKLVDNPEAVRKVVPEDKSLKGPY